MVWGAMIYGKADYFTEKADQQADADDMGLARITWLSKAIETDSNNANTWYDRGLARFDAAAGQPASLARPMLSRAISDFQEAQRLNPCNVFIALGVADAYSAGGDSVNALQSIQKALQLAPLNMSPRLALALELHRMKRWDEAEKAYLWAAVAEADRTDDWIPLYKEMLREARQ